MRLSAERQFGNDKALRSNFLEQDRIFRRLDIIDAAADDGDGAGTERTAMGGSIESGARIERFGITRELTIS